MRRLFCFIAAVMTAWTSYECSALTLEEAAALPAGSEVTIDEAVVINATRMAVSGHAIIQLRDDTRAVTLFPPAPEFLTGLQAGDVISFTANTVNFKGLFELTPSAEPATVVPSPTINTSLDPVPVTATDFADFSPTAEGLESRYVELHDIELFHLQDFYPPHSPDNLGRNVAGEQFVRHTSYAAVDNLGNKTIVWARSQESVDSLNAYFGTIPEGRFDLPGIFLHAYDSDDRLTGEPGISYIMNPVVVGMPGDLNHDGFIGIADLNTVLSHWNASRISPDSLPGDVTHDDFIGIADLNLILSNWNAGTPPSMLGGNLVPEPATALTLTSTVFVLIRRSKMH